MKNIEVDQQIFVNSYLPFHESPSNLHPYIVTKVNTVSFYARPIKGERSLRFNKRSGVATLGSAYRLRAYATEEEYWNQLNAEEEKERLVAEIKRALSTLKLDDLQYLAKFIKNRKG